jgi:hypothetical protein
MIDITSVANLQTQEASGGASRHHSLLGFSFPNTKGDSYKCFSKI